MRAYADQGACIGCGMCVDCPEAFRPNEDEKAEAFADTNDENRFGVLKASHWQCSVKGIWNVTPSSWTRGRFLPCHRWRRTMWRPSGFMRRPIGKIAGEQLIKLTTLGLDKRQAEEEIINGFLA